MKAGRIRSAIPGGDANQDIFRIVAGSFAIFSDQQFVGEFSVRIFVQIFQIRTGGRGVEVVVILFDVLAMVAFTIGEAEEALLEDRIFFVPHGQRETNVLMTIAEPRNAVFTPAVRPGSRMVVRQIIPGVAISAVVFADGAPLALGKIGSPPLPMDFSLGAGFQPFGFGA